ncbi:MAG: hypothetical protein OEY49_08510 [Candidatus Heimdallarchaeota archaeon]|nr:hypothetical protein [Candidatus Heimdallarchaeota archaeon]
MNDMNAINQSSVRDESRIILDFALYDTDEDIRWAFINDISDYTQLKQIILQETNYENQLLALEKIDNTKDLIELSINIVEPRIKQKIIEKLNASN